MIWIRRRECDLLHRIRPEMPEQKPSNFLFGEWIAFE
jgi:hypothetical protein